MKERKKERKKEGRSVKTLSLPISSRTNIRREGLYVRYLPKGLPTAHWLWLSGQSGVFRLRKPAVQIQPTAILIYT